MNKLAHAVDRSRESTSVNVLLHEYEGKKTASQTYIPDVIRRQLEPKDLCRRNTQQAQFRQKRRFDKKDC